MSIAVCGSSLATVSRPNSAVLEAEALACEFRDADERDRCTAPVVWATFGFRNSQVQCVQTTGQSLASPLTLNVPVEWDLYYGSSSCLLC